jgi:photosystem II stability/assembly factor-like uncharacterized protein
VAGCGTAKATTPSTSVPRSTLPVTTTTPTLPIAPTTTPTSCGERIVAPENCLVALSFIDDEHGFGLYQSQTGSRTPLTLVGTKDAGHTWHVISQAPGAFGGSYRPTLLFTNFLDGFMFDDAEGFFATYDGGFTWSQVMLPGHIEDLAVSNGMLWAVLSSCPRGSSATVLCGLGIETSTDSGRSWQTLTRLPKTPFEEGRLALVSPRTAFLLGVHDLTSLDLPDELYATTDGGATWTTRTLPCPTQYRSGGFLDEAPSSNALWLLCGSEGSAGQQGVIIYRSTDDGTSWLGESSCELAGLPTGVRSGSPCASQENFVAMSSTKALDLSIDGGLMLTTDGGVIWSSVRSSTPHIPPGFLGSLDFANPEVGWAAFWVTVGSYAGLWRTTDGGEMWSPVSHGT